MPTYFFKCGITHEGTMIGSNIIPEELRKYIEQQAEEYNYQIVSLLTKGGVSFIEIALDKDGGISVGECGDFNRKIMSWIDEQKIFDGGYTIDVCSPGLDRMLRNDDDFKWAIGKEVEIKVHEPVSDKSSIVGKLLETDEDKENIVIEDNDGNEVNIVKTNIAKAKLWVTI